MVIARSVKEVVEYVLVADRAAIGPRTTFHIRRLPNLTMLRLVELVTHGETRLSHELAVRGGVVGWDGLVDEHGQVVACARSGGRELLSGVEVDQPLTMASFDVLPMSALAELAKAVLDANTLTSDDAKN